MSHVVDDWVARLKPVPPGDFIGENTLFPVAAPPGLRALAVARDCLFDDYAEFDDWSPRQIRLARALFRPSTQKLAEFCRNWEVDVEQEGNRPSPRRAAWTCPNSELMRGAAIKLAPSRELFSVRFAVEGFTASVYGWTVRAFTKELAIVAETDDELVRQDLLPRPLGLVSRRNLHRSVALLFLYRFRRQPQEYPSRLVADTDERAAGAWSEIAPANIDLPNLYRLLLAYEGRAGERALTATDDEIQQVREPDMIVGYAEIGATVERTKALHRKLGRLP